MSIPPPHCYKVILRPLYQLRNVHMCKCSYDIGEKGKERQIHTKTFALSLASLTSAMPANFLNFPFPRFLNFHPLRVLFPLSLLFSFRPFFSHPLNSGEKGRKEPRPLARSRRKSRIKKGREENHSDFHPTSLLTLAFASLLT